MAWTLGIWHIDVNGAGDATLIVARNDGVGGDAYAVRTRSVLICLRINEAGAVANPPTFDVRYRRPDAGTNITNNAAFADAPHSHYISGF